MRRKRTESLPEALERARGRLEKWRGSRTGRRIPEPLWKSAVKLAGSYGIHATSKALRLNYEHLKKRVEAAVGRESPRARPAPSFVEVLTAPPTSKPECLVELEDPRGRKMKIHLKGASAAELVSIGQLFWREEA